MCNLSLRRVAFTLAEVLIVLSIIGIIAESTIPTLKEKVDKQVYVSQLKKFYSTQSNGWKMILADEGVDNLSDTSIFNLIPSYGCEIQQAQSEDCKPFFKALQKYFRFNVLYSPEQIMPKNLNGSLFENQYISYNQNNSILQFAGGSTIFSGSFYNTPQNFTTLNLQKIGAGLKFDVNGLKGPNIQGRDIFQINILNDGRAYFTGQDIWQIGSGSTSCGSPGQKVDLTDSNNDGGACAARIAAEGWVMNY
jgi:prepilin-type N-terminal cleavage/methylation domain-containing protein